MQIKDFPEISILGDNDLLLVQTSQDNAYRCIKKSNLVPSLVTNNPNVDPLDFRYFGDRNGLFYFLGTNGYMQEFQNPSTSDIVEATSSSFWSSDTTVNLLFNRNFSSPQASHTSQENNAFFRVDLGSERSFRCRLYTIRARSGDGTQLPRNWQLQGSNNGIDWIALDNQVNRNDFLEAQWLLIDLENLTDAYRYFQIMQTGPNSSGDIYFTLGQWEMYGRLV